MTKNASIYLKKRFLDIFSTFSPFFSLSSLSKLIDVIKPIFQSDIIKQYLDLAFERMSKK
ncbi:hypothetical protein EAE92_11295 [Photorhabdus hainanensis]|nr:hypothetical protein [Photorhabdus hainanensis]